MAGMKGGRGRGMAVPKGAIKKGTFSRLIKYVFKYYKWHLLLVAVCLLLSAGGGLVSSLFMQKNINLQLILIKKLKILKLLQLVQERRKLLFYMVMNSQMSKMPIQLLFLQ